VTQESNIFSTQMQPSISSYSDHIIISYPLDDLKKKYPNGTDDSLVLFTALDYLAYDISHFHIEALKIGLCFRGAITVGDLYFDRDQNIINGESLNEAIEDESKLANYPRVICSKSLLEYDKKIHKNSHSSPTSLSTNFKRDFDGNYFVDYIGLLFKHFTEKNRIFALKEIRKCIETSIQINKDEKLPILSKWYWLANYFDTNLKHWKNNKKELEYWNITEEINSIYSFDLS